jgi:hypothetical protein
MTQNYTIKPLCKTQQKNRIYTIDFQIANAVELTRGGRTTKIPTIYILLSAEQPPAQEQPQQERVLRPLERERQRPA